MSKSIMLPNNITTKNLYNDPHYERGLHMTSKGYGYSLQKAINDLSNYIPKGGTERWTFYHAPSGLLDDFVCQNDGYVYYPINHKHTKRVESKPKSINQKLDKIISLLTHHSHCFKSPKNAFKDKYKIHFNRPQTRNFNVHLKALEKQLRKDVNFNWNVFIFAKESALEQFYLQITNGHGSNFEQEDNGAWVYQKGDNINVTESEMEKTASLIYSFCKQEDMPVKEFKYSSFEL